jgi:hypothetical protein
MGTQKKKPMRKPSEQRAVDDVEEKEVQKTPLDEATEEHKEPAQSSKKENGADIIDLNQDKSAFAKMPDEVDDPAMVFKMAFLDMKLQATKHQMGLVLRDLQQKAEAIAQQHNKTKSDFEAAIKALSQQVKDQHYYIESKHGIALRSYTYDDETGILRKLDLE